MELGAALEGPWGSLGGTWRPWEVLGGPLGVPGRSRGLRGGPGQASKNVVFFFLGGKFADDLR